MRWTEESCSGGVRGCPASQIRYFLELDVSHIDGVIIQADGEIRWVIERYTVCTPWDEMHLVPEGMELEDVKKLVESILRLKGAE